MVCQGLNNLRLIKNHGGDFGSGAEGLVFSSADVSRLKVLACDFDQKKCALVLKKIRSFIFL